MDQLEEVVEHRLGCAPNMKYFYDPERGTYSGSPHQYNCTYFSALHGNPRHYLLARAIQFFTPGLPMVYYVGLLAGRNDHEVGPIPGSSVHLLQYNSINNGMLLTPGGLYFLLGSWRAAILVEWTFDCCWPAGSSHEYNDLLGE